MSTWGEILAELNHSAVSNGAPNFDGIRRRYLRKFHQISGRAVILYATAWLESKPVPPDMLMVERSDIQGFMEAVSNVRE